jgi:predicted molibdopterin-dependent oxidoreductase YjgC
VGTKKGAVVFVDSPADSPNQGNLCVKGRYGWPYIYNPERLRKPLIKKSGSLTEVEWDEAIAFVVANLGKIKEDDPSKLAALGSARLTNEEAYALNRFVRGALGSPHLDHGGGYSYRALLDGLKPVIGHAGSPNSIREIREADLIVLLDADLTESHPVAKNEVIQATTMITKGEVIIVHGYRSKLCDRDGLKVFVKPGEEYLIALSMLKVIIDEGLYDEKAVDLAAEGFEDLKASLEGYSPEAIAKMTGVRAEIIQECARKYANAEKAAIALTGGLERPGNQALLAQGAACLAIVTGNLGKKGAGLHFFGDKANSQGALDMGLCPELLPGQASLEEEGARKEFEKEWRASLPTEKGFSAREILDGAGSGSIKGLFVVGENPVDTYPDREFVAAALEKLEFLVVQDLFLTSTAQKADAVLPVASFMEKSGTYTSSDRRVQLLRARPIMDGVKTDLEVICALARGLGDARFQYQGPEDVFKEISKMVPFYKGLSYERLEPFGLTWPCVDGEDPGKETLCEGGFPGGKARLLAMPGPEAVDGGDLPFTLIPVVLKFHSGSLSQWSRSLMDVKGTPAAEMNRKDMKRLGLGDGDTIKVNTEAGHTATIQVKASRRALEGVILAPYHYSAIRLNSVMDWDSPGVKVGIEKA